MRTMLAMRENLDFLREIVQRDTHAGVYGGRVATRFPPEPNGFLHIGHAKSICINFGIAAEFGGVCHLRFDDTNPETEDMKYVDSIRRDVRWLGFDWKEKLFFASDYYEQLYELAVRLVRDGKAYVDSRSDEEIRKGRGTITEAGADGPYRNRSVEENLDLFARMKAGEFPDGAHVLRAKIDMAARNMKLRDPLLYRIRHATHYRRGDAWCLYPMYDFAHPLSDAIEGITHSICTLEFENNRAIYDWLVDNLFPEPRPRQYEFARLNLDYTVMSKRKLLQLVEEGLVSGWDDPRLPTIAGMRRRGYAPEGIRLFAARIGVDKANSRVSMELLEDAIRDDLNARAPRAMAVLRPLKATIANWPDDRVEGLEIPLWPKDAGNEGTRTVPLTREIRIDRSDFSLTPPADWRRLRPGRRGAAHGRLLLPVRRGRSRPGHRRGGGTPLLVRPGVARSAGQGGAEEDDRDPVGVRFARGPGRSPPVRPPVHRRGSRERGGREDVQGFSEPGLGRGAAGVSPRTRPRLRRPRGPVPVRPPRLLHRRRSGLEARRPRLQPHCRTEGQVPPTTVANRGTGTFLELPSSTFSRPMVGSLPFTAYLPIIGQVFDGGPSAPWSWWSNATAA